MLFVTIDNTEYLAEAVQASTVALRAMEVRSGDANWALKYVQKANLGELIDLTFGNAIFTQRDLTAMENGALQMASTAMQQAKEMAVAQIENDYAAKLLGK